MKKIARKLTVAAMAVVMASSMAISISAAEACTHQNMTYTRELEPHYSYSTHIGASGGTCTIRTTYRTICTYCYNCGLLNSSNITTTSHSDPNC